MSTGARGLFVDLDGTLADSTGMLRRVYDSFLQGFGRRGSDREFASLNGPRIRDLVAVLQQRHELGGDLRQLRRSYATMVRNAYPDVPARPGARQFLANAQRYSWRVAVVTSAPRVMAEGWLANVGLSVLVATVIAGEDVDESKPSPQAYLHAIDYTDCAAALSIAVEDSLQGAASAVGAGLRTYVVGGEPGNRSAWPAVAGFVEGLPQLNAVLADV